jgi:hypothetical protein
MVKLEILLYSNKVLFPLRATLGANHNFFVYKNLSFMRL